MSKLTKQDKIHIFEEWTLEHKRGVYLSKKYGITRTNINYLVNLIKIHGLSILDKPHTQYSKEYKDRAIKRVLFGNEAVVPVALELGLSSAGMLSNWIRSYRENGYNVVIKQKGRRTHEQEKAERIRAAQARKRRATSPEFKAYCRKRIYKKIGCLGSKKKEPTKTEIAQAVRELRLELGLGVKTILSILNDLNNDLPGLSRSNYYDILKREDQDEIRHHSLIKRIKEIFFELKDRYTAPGYRTITDHLHSEGFIINRKTVYRLMRKLNLIGYRMKRRRRYNSFEGEIEGRIKPNLIKRNFFAIRPNMKWYTDITEFNLRGQKLYLSPIIDGCGRDIVAYNISRSPNLQQVMTMLDDAFKVNDSLNGLVFHSDRGWQYQHKTYQYELARRGIEQSMSRKGCSPDDGLMEGFFGILKREMFYGKESNYANLNELEQAIKDYIHFYNYERTKSKLKGLTPIQYRNQSLVA
ncbi:MAG: IS3 family transposase [Lactobacillus crispatus]|nr:IS3 family transposase [Lactobacillus crispatus]